MHAPLQGKHSKVRGNKQQSVYTLTLTLTLCRAILFQTLNSPDRLHPINEQTNRCNDKVFHYNHHLVWYEHEH